MGPPYDANFCPDSSLHSQIALYLHELMGLRQDQIKTKLPDVMPAWGRVHILNGGDHIWSKMVSSKYREGRDASHIHVCSL